MCARLVKKIWCDYIIDCSCYSEENKNRHNFLCATAWIAIAAKSDVWIAITFSLLMQMPRFTYHFNSFNLLFKAVPNLVQNIAFEKNLPVPTIYLVRLFKLRKFYNNNTYICRPGLYNASSVRMSRNYG